MDAARTLRPYFLMEARSFSLRGASVSLFAGAVMIGLSHVFVPKLPQAVLSLLEKTFHLKGMAAIFLVNDYLALYTVLFFGGLAELLRALVAPREGRQLEMLLSKPLSASTWVLARAVPVLSAIWLVGLVLGAGTALSIVPYSSPESATATGAFFGFVSFGSFVVLILAALTPLLVRSKDAFEALIISFCVWVAPLLPSTVFLYRPDLYEGRPALASVTVLPANLLWHDAKMPLFALVTTLLSAILCAAFLLFAGRVLSRTGAAR